MADASPADTTTAVTLPPEPISLEAAPTGPQGRWQQVSGFVWRYAASMFLENKDGTNIWAVSLGRVSTIALLTQAMWHWQCGVDMLPTQKEVLYVMIGYTFGSKTLSAAKDIVSTIKGAQ